jgi:hypothetical protein
MPKGEQRSTKHTHKTKYRVTWTPLKTGGELWIMKIYNVITEPRSSLLKWPQGQNESNIIL